MCAVLLRSRQAHRDIEPETVPAPSVQFSSVQSLSHVWLFATPWIAAHQVSLSITNSWSSPKLMSIESVMPSSHLILCFSLLLPPIPPNIRVFSNESPLRMRWQKYWSFSFSISPSKEQLIYLLYTEYDFLIVSERKYCVELNKSVRYHSVLSLSWFLWFYP